VKVLVFVDHFIVGGVPINSIDLSTVLARSFGHEIVLFGAPGPAIELAKERGLRFIAAPRVDGRPCLGRMRTLARVIRSERPDLVHAWDWRACVEAHLVAQLLLRVPLLVSHSTMALERLLPKKTPTMYMTPELVDLARADGREPVAFLPVPTDIPASTQSADGAAFRTACAARDDDIVLVTVSRLDSWIKSESLIRTIAVTRRLGAVFKSLKFVIVGDGEARAELERHAAEANAALGRQAVVLYGEMVDPRAAYVAADIIVGMGGSALRGMASGKPVIIVGKNGFAAKLDAGTQDDFLYRGMYGSGDGGDTSLEAAVRQLAGDAHQRAQHGELARQFVERHFSLPVAAADLEHFMRLAVNARPSVIVSAMDALRMMFVYAAVHIVPPSARSRLRGMLSSRRRRAEPTNAIKAAVWPADIDASTTTEGRRYAP
jgi:L-malate glycosyltransferase